MAKSNTSNDNERICPLSLSGKSKRGMCITLTKQAFESATGFQKTAYYDAISKLKKLGYLIEKYNGELYFSTAPFRNDGSEPQHKEQYFGEVFYRK